MRLQDKKAIVTGGSRSIGRAIALGFAREGADVAIVYEQHGEEAEQVVKEIQQLGRQSFAVQCDVSNAAQVAAMVEKVAATFGRVDVLMANAGVLGRMPFLEISEEVWDRIIDVDLKGPFLVGQAVARQMIKQGTGGAIVNTSSVSATSAAKELTHYQAAKAGVTMLTRGMALELAEHGIRVNCIEPGLIETDMNRLRISNPEVRQQRLSRIPLNRIGTPEDLVGAAIYLASDEASYTSGAALRVDGASTVW
ncbi:MAG: SDR family NAD(P)-dependent oxidoreductase [Chloroflexota bacterium]